MGINLPRKITDARKDVLPETWLEHHFLNYFRFFSDLNLKRVSLCIRKVGAGRKKVRDMKILTYGVCCPRDSSQKVRNEICFFRAHPM
jgi:hypothetical protein